MKGKYAVTVQNNVLQYKFEIRRNITIIKGDSATGKTTLVDMIRDFYENGEHSGISLKCDKICVVLEGRQWKYLLDNIHESIVFIDEGNAFISTDEFAAEVKQSDNYFVIVTREGLPNLPYSVEEIYGIKVSGKFGSLQRTYQEFYHIYGILDYSSTFNPDVIIVEDSNSGFEFYKEAAKERKWEVISAGGKSNIFSKLTAYGDKKLLVIADGAAFGSEIDKIMKKIKTTTRIAVYLPESFEWLILNSELLRDTSIKDVLDNPSDYIDSKKYMSWERFFTSFLIDKTKNTYLQYSKSKLNDVYKTPKVRDKVLKEIPEGLF